MMYDIM